MPPACSPTPPTCNPMAPACSHTLLPACSCAKSAQLVPSHPQALQPRFDILKAKYYHRRGLCGLLNMFSRAASIHEKYHSLFNVSEALLDSLEPAADNRSSTLFRRQVRPLSTKGSYLHIPTPQVPARTRNPDPDLEIIRGGGAAAARRRCSAHRAGTYVHGKALDSCTEQIDSHGEWRSHTPNRVPACPHAARRGGRGGWPLRTSLWRKAHLCGAQ